MITNFFFPELNNHDVQELWFQQDGATCHTARATIDLLKDTFGDRLISRFGPVNWPPRSCDLTPLDYFLIVAPHTPTHINSSSRPGARDSIIDLAVLKNISFNHDIRVIDDLRSDHLPVIFILYTGSALIKIPHKLSTNMENFKFRLNNKPLPIPPSSSNDDLEIAIGRLGENISEALVEASKPKFK
ncbi:uncharacterized protein TNCV_3136731 [Trichonephila clavipes]|nr:uncharacterized protein TNCV_3136731 [Trichonephila clavipes]